MTVDGCDCFIVFPSHLHVIKLDEMLRSGCGVLQIHWSYTREVSGVSGEPLEIKEIRPTSDGVTSNVSRGRHGIVQSKNRTTWRWSVDLWLGKDALCTESKSKSMVTLKVLGVAAGILAT